MSVNKVILVGRLGVDPTLRYTTDGHPVCDMRLATSRFKSNGEEETQWHRLVAWNEVALSCKEHLSKGRQIYVEGRLQTRAYKDRRGNNRWITEVVALTVHFLGRRRDAVSLHPLLGDEQPVQRESTRGA